MEYGRPRRRGGWGWREPSPLTATSPQHPRCTIARVHHSQLSPAQFRSEYADRNLPVMIVGAADPTARAAAGDGSGLASAWELWSKDALIKAHGDEVRLLLLLPPATC
jgi:hypothetical protein